MDTNLSKEENEQLIHYCAAFNLDPRTLDMTRELVQCYKRRNQCTILEKLEVIVSCAVLAASEAQVIRTVGNQKTRGVGISLGQLIKKHACTSTAANLLKEIRSFVDVMAFSPDVSKKLQQIVEDYNTTQKHYSEYCKALDCSFSNSQDKDQAVLLKVGWLLFIIAKRQTTERTQKPQDMKHILSAALYILIRERPASFNTAKFAESQLQPYNEQQNGSRAFIASLSKIWNDHELNIVDFKRQEAMLEQLLLKLILKEDLQSKTPQSLQGVLSSDIVTQNLRALDCYYEKLLSPDESDERFYQNTKTLRSPDDFSLLAPQCEANNNDVWKRSLLTSISNASNESKRFQSQRRLSYDLTESVTMQTKLREIKARKSSINSLPDTLQAAITPRSLAFEMRSWIDKKIRKLRKTSVAQCLNQLLTDLPQVEISKRIEELQSLPAIVVDRESSTAKRQACKEQINAIYLDALEELLKQEERREQGRRLEILLKDEFHRALIASSIETALLINGCNYMDLGFEDRLKACGLQVFEFWKILVSFTKFDPEMPFHIKKHLFDLEKRVVTELAWKQGTQVHQLIQKFFEANREAHQLEAESNTTEIPLVNPSTIESPDISQLSTQMSDSKQHPEIKLTHSEELFFKGVLSKTAIEVQGVKEKFALNDDVAEKIWLSMKYILSSKTGLLINRQLEQLILCTMYGVCKTSSISLSFADIKSKCQESSSDSRYRKFEVVFDVSMEDGSSIDIIKFYNTVYLKEMKQYLCSFNSQQSQSSYQANSSTPLHRPVIPALTMDSPLHLSLPQCNSSASDMRSRTPILKALLTPMTNRLFAFESSPTGSLDTNKAPIANTRPLDFEESLRSTCSWNQARKPNPALSKITKQSSINSLDKRSIFIQASGTSTASSQEGFYNDTESLTDGHNKEMSKRPDIQLNIASQSDSVSTVLRLCPHKTESTKLK